MGLPACPGNHLSPQHAGFSGSLSIVLAFLNTKGKHCGAQINIYIYCVAKGFWLVGALQTSASTTSHRAVREATTRKPNNRVAFNEWDGRETDRKGLDIFSIVQFVMDLFQL